MGYSDRVKQSRKNRKLNLIKVYGGKCSLCGQDKCADALAFHHINSEDKLFEISSGNCHKIEDDLAESKKCLLVCNNCHSEIHAGLQEGQDLFKYQVIDEEFAQSLIPKSHQNLLCSECGKPITIYSSTGLCASCVQKLHRTIERPNREELKEKIRTQSFLSIGKDYNVTDNAIRKWCKTYNLPNTKKEINKISEEDWKNI